MKLFAFTLMKTPDLSINQIQNRLAAALKKHTRRMLGLSFRAIVSIRSLKQLGTGIVFPQSSK